MKAHFAYLRYVFQHKWYVFLACYRAGITWLGIIHDWTKFTPVEWFPYVKTFYNPDGSKKDGGFRAAGLYPKYALANHLHSNKHHWLRWVLPDGEALPIPERYLKEMVADWRGASMAITGKDNTPAWYWEHQKEMNLHPDTRQWIEDELGVCN